MHNIMDNYMGSNNGNNNIYHNNSNSGRSNSNNSNSRKKMLIEEKNAEILKLFIDISKEARKEKSGRPPINKLLYWWTRKPLIVSRAITLLSTTPADKGLDTVVDKLGLNNGEERRAYKYKPSIQVDPSIKILDPFGGAGNLLFESVRAGFDCSLIDYNPVAYLILKATLEYPVKYKGLADDVRKYGEEVIKRAREELARFYKREGAQTLAYLWCWCIICPYCRQRVPLTNRTILSKKHKIGYEIKPTNDKNFTVEIERLREVKAEYTQKDGKVVCINCHNAINYKDMTNDIAKRRDKELIAVVTNGKSYDKASEEDKDVFNSAKEELERRWDWLLSKDLIPFEKLKASELQRATNYGLIHWYEFFNERQLLLFTTLVRIIHEVLNNINDKEYAKAIATYLGILVCKHVDYNCIGITWDAGYSKISHALAFRSPRINYNFAEVNPFEKTAGSLYNMLNNIVDAIEFVSNNNNKIANIKLGSACRLNNYPEGKFNLVITDPPYLDDVPYAEASELFYVWLVRILKDFYPELPNEVPIDEDLISSRGRFDGNLKQAMEFYKRGMVAAFQNIYKVLDDDGLLIVFFAHSKTEAWNLLLEVLREAKFRVVSSFAVHTESEENVMMRGKVSFKSSIVLACRKILEDKETYFESLIPKIEDEISKLIKILGKDDNNIFFIPITDFIIMAYGKVLEELTQYTKIKSYRADFRPDFENFIGQARDFIFTKIVEILTGRAPQSLGSIASFILIAKIFYRGLPSSDETLKITKTFDLDEDMLIKKGYIEKVKEDMRIRPFTKVTLNMKPEEIDKDDVYQQYLYILKIADKEGAGAVKRLLSYANFRVQDLKHIISLLIKHYSLLKNKGEKMSEDEDKEFGLLKDLADIIGGGEGGRGSTLDGYY